jgi:SAM-dependent methyltransferase
MVNTSPTSLMYGPRKAVGFAKAQFSSVPAPSQPSQRVLETSFKGERLKLLHEIPSHVIKKAWFTMAHLLLDPGASVIDIGCGRGPMTCAMASLNPELDFQGIDINADSIANAQRRYKRPNLSYRCGDLLEPFGEPGSADAIVNSFVLHEAYSNSQYNERLIPKILQLQYETLRDNGYILIRDFALPVTGEYVLMEIRDNGVSSNDIAKMSDADFLIWYSENALSRHDGDPAGFFMDELPPNFPGTRLFRLPMKWAYEFFLRKDDRGRLKETLGKEYTFLNEQEFRRELGALGARIVYSAPHWDEGFLKTRYDGKIRLYREDGTPMGPPPTSHVFVAQKIAGKKSQILQERRTSRAKNGRINLQTVRDERTGEVTDIATRNLEIAEVIPYRIAPDGRLKLYLHHDMPRGLVNSVPRMGKNLDGRRWSGHLTEAMAMPLDELKTAVDLPYRELRKFAMIHIGLRPSLDAELARGPGFYPDPYRIEERVETWFYRVEDYHAPFEPKTMLEDATGFSAKGEIREFDAQAIMNAIAVGLIPSSRLETQILALHDLVKIPTEVWSEMPVQISELAAEEVQDITDVVRRMTLGDNRFKKVKNQAGNIRVVQSVFVDEGRDEGGGMTNLAARDMEFIYQDNGTINTAVVLPLVKDLQGEVLAGIVSEYLPVPQRYKGTGLLTTLPSFPLPKDVTDIDSAKRFIASKFNVDVKYVGRMGESFHTHIGMTPHRIYPFVVTNMRGSGKGRGHGTTMVTPLYNLWKLLYWDNSDSFMKIVAQAYKNFCQDSSLSVRWDFDVKLAQPGAPRIAESTPMAGLGASAPVQAPLAAPVAAALPGADVQIGGTTRSARDGEGSGEDTSSGHGEAVPSLDALPERAETKKNAKNAKLKGKPGKIFSRYARPQ